MVRRGLLCGISVVLAVTLAACTADVEQDAPVATSIASVTPSATSTTSTTTSTTVPTHATDYPDVALEVRELADGEEARYLVSRDDEPDTSATASPEVGADSIRQAPFSGLFSVEVPVDSGWLFNPQYDAIVAVPTGDPFVQGDFQWALSSGAELRSSGMRIQYSDSFETSLISDAPLPSNCGDPVVATVSRSEMGGEEAQYRCGESDLLLGYLQAGSGHIVYAVADAPGMPAGFLLEMLDSIQVHNGDAVPALGFDDPASFDYRNPDPLPERTFFSGLNGAYPIDIGGGDTGGTVAMRLDILSTSMMAIRNFDGTPYRLTANGGEVMQLPPRSAVTIDVDQFETNKVHLAFESGPFVAYGVTLDLTRRTLGPPIEMYARESGITLETRSLGVQAMEQEWGIEAIVLKVPEGWEDQSYPSRGEYRFARSEQENDPAEIQFWPHMALNLEGRIMLVTVDTLVEPVEIDTFRHRGEIWTIYHWEPEGHPLVTAVFTSWTDVSSGFAMLISAPDDHVYLYDTVLIPLIESYRYDSGD